MNRILCNKIELIHISDIVSMEKDQITIRDGMEFLLLPLEDSASFSRQSSVGNPGVVFNDQVTARLKFKADYSFINTQLKYYVLRLHTDASQFIVGSLDYPAELTFTTDNIFVNLTFKASMPA